MFLRKTSRLKDGKVHDYWSVAENIREWGACWLGLYLWDLVGLDAQESPTL